MGWRVAVLLIGTMVWLEIVVAGLVRHGSEPSAITASELDAVGFYASFVAALGVLTFTFLYLL